MKTKDFIKLLQKLPQNVDVVFALYTDTCAAQARETIHHVHVNNAYGGACVSLHLERGQYIAKRKAR